MSLPVDTRKFLDHIRQTNAVGLAGNLLAFYGEDPASKQNCWRDAAQVHPRLSELLRGEHCQTVRAVLAAGACDLREVPLRPWNHLSPSQETMPWPPKKLCVLRFDPTRCRILSSNSGGRKSWRLIAFVGDESSKHVRADLKDRYRRLISDCSVAKAHHVVALMQTPLGNSVAGMTFEYDETRGHAKQVRFKGPLPLLRPYVIVTTRNDYARVLRVPYN